MRSRISSPCRFRKSADTERHDCFTEKHLKKKGEIVRDGSTVTCAEKQYTIEDVVGRYGKLWTELCPENGRLTVNGNIYVHWYDSFYCDPE